MYSNSSSLKKKLRSDKFAMPEMCIISRCKSGYSGKAERVSLFKVPKDEVLRAKWVKAVTPVINGQLKKTHKICEKHFHQSDIVRQFVHKDGDGQIIAQVAFKLPRLTKMAVPSVFASPSYHCDKTTLAAAVEPQSDNKLHQSISQQTVHMENIGHEINLSTSKQSLVGSISENSFLTPNNQSAMSVENVAADVDTIALHTLKPEATTLMSIKEDHSVSGHSVSKNDVMAQYNEISSTRDSARNSATFGEMFIKIYNDANAVKLPLGWCRYTSSKRWVAFSTFDVLNKLNCLQLVLRKSILLTKEGNIHVSANGKGVPIGRICHSLDRIYSIEDLSRLLTSLATIKLCSGIELSSHSLMQSKTMHRNAVGDWCNKNCSIVCTTRICSSCQRLKKSFSQRTRRLSKQPVMRRIGLSHKSLAEKAKIGTIKRRLRSQAMFIGRVRERVRKLQDAMTELQNRIRGLNEESIMDKCDKINLPHAQRLCVQEMIASVNKKSPQANRYNEDWIMLCMLMYIRSPAHYRLLLKNEILPLPSPRTIRRYLTIITSNSGFDTNFFQLFKKRMESKSSMPKHGVLLLDDISVREAVTVSNFKQLF